VELTKQQRIAASALIIAASALAIDRFVLVQQAGAATPSERTLNSADAAETPQAAEVPATQSGAVRESALAERLSSFALSAPAAHRTDAFLVPASMILIEPAETLEVARGEAGSAASSKAPSLVISSVIDGPNPVVLINGTPLTIGGQPVDGFRLIGVDADDLGIEADKRGAFVVRVMDEKGNAFALPFSPRHRAAATKQHRADRSGATSDRAEAASNRR